MQTHSHKPDDIAHNNILLEFPYPVRKYYNHVAATAAAA